jgi:hypothetical protein
MVRESKLLQKIADHNFGSKANKLLISEDQNTLWAVLVNGSWLEIRLGVDQENKRFLSNLQETMFNELPFIAGTGGIFTYTISKYRS